MLKIAFVEETEEETKRVQEYCARFHEECNEEIELLVYPNGLKFLSDYQPGFQLVFMDIDMPILNGLEASKSLREMDKEVAIVFYTNLAKYAVKGYEVNALDFLVKPVSYLTFKAKLKKWMPLLKERKQKVFALQVAGGGAVRLSLSDIYYIESVKHYLVYHTRNDTYQTRGTIRDAEKQFAEEGFSRPIGGMLVNLEYVTKVEKDTICLKSGEESIVLPLARTRKKEFMIDFMEHLKKGG